MARTSHLGTLHRGIHSVHRPTFAPKGHVYFSFFLQSLEGNPLLQIEVEPTSEVRTEEWRSNFFQQSQLMSLMTQRTWGGQGGAGALSVGCAKSGTTNKWRPLPAVNLMGRYMACIREKLDVRKLANDLHS